MQVSISELKINIGKYIELAEEQDIFITKKLKVDREGCQYKD